MTIAKRRKLVTFCIVIFVLAELLLGAIRFLEGESFARAALTYGGEAAIIGLCMFYLRSQIRDTTESK
jgi:hypothetical protein